MRGLINFDAGEVVTIEGRHLNFHGLVPPVKDRPDGSCDLQFLDARNRKANIFTPDQFMAAYEAGHVQYHRARKMPGDEAGDDETPSKAISRRWRLFWTTSFDAAPVPKSTKKLKAFIEQNVERQPDPISPPSPHPLRHWLRDRGEPEARRPKQMGDRRRSSLARRPVHEFVQHAFDEAAKKYWSNYRATFEDVQLQVRAAVMAENSRRRKESLSALSVPGRTTLWRWLRQERTYPNVLTREGRHVADRLFKGARGLLSAKRILDVTIIDQKRMDVHICDPSGRFTIGRPWLAVLIDVKSRMVLGYSLSFEEPSVLKAMACIRAAMGGPLQLKERFPSVEGQWESFGMPRTILVDNAWENTGSSFADACSDNHISIEYAPVRTPQYKGILERFFSRLDDQFAHKLRAPQCGMTAGLQNPKFDFPLSLAGMP